MKRYPIVYISGQPAELPEYDRLFNGSNVLRSLTAPAPAVEGDLWFDSALGSLKIFDSSTWVNVIGGPGTSTSAISATAPSPPGNGQLWYDTVNGVLKVYLLASASWKPCQFQITKQTAAPATNLEEGDIWINSVTGVFSMYIAGSGWSQMGAQTSIADILAFS